MMDSDTFRTSQFNRSKIYKKQIDTLLGLAQGITADNIVTQQEAEYLHDWLIKNEATLVSNPIFDPLINRLSEMLADNVLDEEEATELLRLLKDLSGDNSVLGEVLKTIKGVTNDPPPEITFLDRNFAFTGTFSYGSRRECKVAVIERGGHFCSGVNMTLDYLVLGSYVTDSWKHQNYGTKIEKAIEYRNRERCRLAIVTETHWVNSMT